MGLFRKTAFGVSCIICLISLFIPENHKKTNRIELFVEKYSKILLAVTVLVAIVVRFYDLDRLPAGLHIDEWSIAYDAWALNTYGLDRHLKHNPVYLINYGGGQNTLLLYMMMLSYRVFGNNIFAIRFPTALMGVVAVIAIYGILTKTGNKTIANIGAFLAAIMPVFINMSRFSLESYLLYSMLAVSVWRFIYAIDCQKVISFIIAGTVMGLTLYSYALSYAILPVFLALSVIYLAISKKINFKQLFALGVPVFILAVPLMLMLIINKFDLPEIVTPLFTIPRLWEFRAGEMGWNGISNIPTVLFNILVKDWLSYNSDDVFNTLYLFSVPLVAFGCILLVKEVCKELKNRRFSYYVIVFFALCSTVFVAMITSEINVNKANGVYAFILIVIAIAVYSILKRSKAMFFIVMVLYSVHFCLFANWYFSPQKYTELHLMFRPALTSVFELVDEISDTGKYRFIDDAHYPEREMHLALVEQLPPQEVYQLIYNESSDHPWLDNIPFAVTEDGKVTFEIDKEVVYIIYRKNLREVNRLIEDYLVEQGFSLTETTFYRIYNYVN